MGNNNSGKKAAAVPPPAPKQTQTNQVVITAQNIKLTVARLEKRRDFLNKKVHQEITQAKLKAKANNKKGALLHIKKKKVYEKEVTKLEGQIFTLEQQSIAVESGSVNVDIVNAMKQGVAAQKHINQQIDVDATADLVDEIQEIQADADEVSELLAQPMQDAFDDDELMNELNELGEEELLKETAALETPLPKVPDFAIGSEMNLPEAPSHQPNAAKAKAKSDEEALAELMGEMAG
mmetsp:Transcript_5608/g.7105  ORF Transcript_5608/g.7105 Transcript_5608/m.7105 type:complete len:236 (+) Transcript_5608:305-1012(+)|eukprot:CAMPEP_0204850260 /NCGR_PEP_ID=MMETSP1347-20130617/7823_1 /ASSEMBLY_ACC=CAM_ASM_000690 /TAXON_ID=215587 /ORGANISM="Aplanochytrium stocchinoi, Strain GSBS06" /LENGTH=235 /DNA_ID=CAMNT_0051993129 /DNA_START=223 /DNA_END=930 /DNA_ORIENTATION=+